MAIPTRTECYRLIFESGMLDHIVAHSLQVSRVALLLTDALNASGADLDRPLIRSAALLHDITKTRSLETGERHSETGAEFL
ncbi:MAG: HDIG domain-containing metalloprotein, partial [Thermodesulfobacteriota bacterium]